MPFNKEIFYRLADFIAQEMRDPATRPYILMRALSGCHVLEEIEMEGDPDVFAFDLVETLGNFGECKPGEHALILLLTTLRYLADETRRQDIDALIEEVRDQIKRSLSDADLPGHTIDAIIRLVTPHIKNSNERHALLRGLFDFRMIDSQMFYRLRYDRDTDIQATASDSHLFRDVQHDWGAEAISKFVHILARNNILALIHLLGIVKPKDSTEERDIEKLVIEILLYSSANPDLLTSLDPTITYPFDESDTILLIDIDELDNVQAPPAPPPPVSLFSAYFPSTAPINQQSGLLIYAFTDEMKSLVVRHVAKYQEELGGTIPNPRMADRSVPLDIGTLITVVPECPGIEIEPKSLSKTWRGDWTRFEFGLIPSGDIVNKLCVIEVSIQVDGIEIAHIQCALDISMQFAAQNINPLMAAKLQVQSVEPYQRIFICYSKKDRRVARAYKNAQKALGNKVFLDVDTLRTGSNWQAALAHAIDKADVFQLFWSKHSATSERCRHEWSYALSTRCNDRPCEGFIRPVYWQRPMPPTPPELAPFNFRYCAFEKGRV